MLLTEETKKVINLAEIGRGSLISAKNKTWDKAQSGIVTEAIGVSPKSASFASK